ncbi:MAG: hypothetical protein IT318_00490 [Anaerolineales bacterium]|nr:hypothetical protein [Anaerolineales bacterium]
MFSHTLPWLVAGPLLSLLLVNVVETRVLIPELSSELRSEAALIASQARDLAGLWSDPRQAQAFVERLDQPLEARLMLVDPEGILLASSSAADRDLIGQPLEHSELERALAGDIVVREDYSRVLRAEVADVLTPVLASDGKVLGVVRLSHPLTNVFGRFVRVRTLIAGLVGLGSLAGMVVGWLLAANLQRSLRGLTHAVRQLASGQPWHPLPEPQLEELAVLAHAHNALVERLRALEAARRQLLANLVHELGRPLGALRSAAQALLGGADSDPELRRELLAGMGDEIDRLRRLLDDLAQLHDRVAGALELARNVVSLPEWLPRVLAPWQAAADRKGLYWESSLPDDLPTLRLDADRLGQALGNLVSNACKFTPAGGTVAVGAGVAGSEVWIRVGDTGPGIAPQDHEHIFEPLYRGQTGRRFPQGMGLGLTIARDLIQAHGGRLTLDSAPGLGSQFTVWLPLSPLAAFQTPGPQ